MERVALGVVIELISRYFRQRQKAVERAIEKLQADIAPGGVLDPATATPEVIEGAADKLQDLCTQVEEWEKKETDAVKLLMRRAEILRTGAVAPLDFDCLICEHLLRAGKLRTGLLMYNSVLSEQQRTLVNKGVLLEIVAAKEALLQCNLRPALAWVQANASRLRRIGSNLEFMLRKQEFVELVRTRQLVAALDYATAFLAPAAKAAVNGGTNGSNGNGAAAAATTSGNGHAAGGTASTAQASGTGTVSTGIVSSSSVTAPTWIPPPPAGTVEASGSGSVSPGLVQNGGAPYDCMAQLQVAMSMLAFADPVRCGVPSIERQFSDSVWPELAARYETDAHEAAGCTQHSVLSMLLATGVQALSTPSCQNAASSAGLPSLASGSVSPLLVRGVTTASPPTVATTSAPAFPATSAPLHAQRYVSVPTSAYGRDCPLCTTPYFAAVMYAPSGGGGGGGGGATPVHPPATCTHSHSTLLCPITREALNDSNPPMALPNGNVYGASTIAYMTSEDKLQVVCPRTGTRFPASSVRRVYVI